MQLLNTLRTKIISKPPNYVSLTLPKFLNRSSHHFLKIQQNHLPNCKKYSITPNLTNFKNFQETSMKLSELPQHKHTICALASGSGACGVAVIRISGPNSLNLSTLMIKNRELKPRYATFTKIYHPIKQELIDTGLVLWFPGPKSFTGEDVIEFQVHGSPAIVKCLLSGIIETELARIAEAGEFTRRAFYNNKMDLAEVEGLRDLLSAETDIQRKQALTMSRGVQSKKINDWISRLSDCTSLIDGHIEFGDTDDVLINIADINKSLTQIQNELQQAIKTSAKGFTIKNGISIALYGVTNVGKSSLLNALTSEDRAIVSEMPNTTRDMIQVRMDLNGYAVNLTDTAGFYNDPSHRVETDAMQKSIEVLFDSNTAIHVLVISADIYLNYLNLLNSSDTTDSTKSGDNTTKSVNPAVILRKYVKEMFVSGLIREDVEDIDKLFVKNTLVVVTKMDLVEKNDFIHFNELLRAKNVIGTSIVNNLGVGQVFDGFNQQIKELYYDFSPDDIQFSTIRTLEAVKMASKSIDDAISVGERSIDMKSQFLRAAIARMAGILGKSCTADMLDDVFENFCVGK